MPKAGARALALDDVLRSAGMVPRPPVASPRLPDLPLAARSELTNLFREMGGSIVDPDFRPGRWDLSYDDLLVELDEELHFNRYRAMTLAGPVLSGTPWAVAYRRYCDANERRSGTGGKRWTNPSAERIFGPADPHWTFDGGGAPRWKQRALYDAMKDAAAAVGIVRLARISVYDEVDGVLVEDLLRGRASSHPSAVRSFVESRAVGEPPKA